MFQKLYEFDVDFMRKYPVPSITFTRDDTNVNVFNITLVSNGTPIDITGCTVELRFRKTDGTVVSDMATITDSINGKITYELKTDITNCVGAVLCGIMLYGQNDERASSYPFRFTVIDDIGDNYDPVTSNQYPIITQLIAETTEIRNDYLELMNGGGGTNHIHLNMNVLQALEDDGTGTGILYNGNPIQGSGGTADSIAWLNVTGKPTFASVATSGSYTDLVNRPTIPTQPTLLSQLSEDTTHRLTTDTEKTNWNSKQNALSGDIAGHYHSADRNWTNITNKPTIPTLTSQLTNDSGFATTTYVDDRVSQVTGGSGGDMYRSTYDTDLDGIVDRAEIADSVQWTNVQGRPTIPTDTNQLVKSDVYNKTEIDTQLNDIVAQIGSGGVTWIDLVDGEMFELDILSTNIPVTNVSISPTIATINKGNTRQLTATVYPLNATNKNVAWSSLDISIATVSTSGLVTVLAAGSVNIIATTEDGAFTATCTITATDITTISVTGVTLDKTTASYTIGGGERLTATVYPTDATNKNVTWSSSNSSVVSVADGILTCSSAGTETISVTTQDGGYIATCTVTVSAEAKCCLMEIMIKQDLK